MPSLRLLEPQPEFWPRATVLSLSGYLGGLLHNNPGEAADRWAQRCYSHMSACDSKPHRMC